MENNINFFKAKPLTISLVILLAVLIVFVAFQLGGLGKPQKMLPTSETVEEEIVPITETKLQAEEKPILSLEKKFTIQVASFQEMTRAEKVSVGLKEKGYQPVISAKELPEKETWYRVFVGDFDNEEAAKELLNTLKETYKDSFIKLR
ncbi:MAG: SPOR domain-containing protein [Candidatus Omnitrophota bacterium]|nr:SPOR domain-containing protein [Candidatus Omnitrophota bacterium]